MPNDENNPAAETSGQSPDSLATPLPEDSLESSEPSTPAESSIASPLPPGIPPPVPRGPNLLKRLRTRTNTYLLVFILLITVGVIVIYVIATSNKDSLKTSGTTTLTAEQLAQLKGNTTLVGDAKQTLDVQSNAIFESQVLVRGDLNVAGSIKTGTSLNLNSITVSGNGNFGELGVSGNLAVGGNTTLQGQLTVQKSLSVSGIISASQLTVTTLQLQGNLTLSNHVTISGGVPSRSNGTALGSGGTSSVSGSDTGGTVTINTGSGPPAGCFVIINFTQKFGNTPHVVISPSNSAAASLQYYANRTANNFSVCTVSVPAASTTYVFDYVVFG
jgi:hypothetical protein